jgi:phage shock protein PspC (stress-responsive transcriptional regulator)
MTTSKQLTRSNSSRMLAGVCGGLGEFLDIDPTILRLAFVFGSFISGGTALVVYIVMAMVVPLESVNA